MLYLRHPSALKISKLLIDILKVVKYTLEQLDTKTGIQASGRGADTVHTELRDTAINGSHSDLRAGHGPNGTATARVVADLEDLQS